MLRRAAAFVLVLVACSSSPSSDPNGREPERTQASAIIKGSESDYTEDEVILLVSLDQGISACSGTLLAPNLVLTARHCVSYTNNTPFACDVKGNLINFQGPQIGADHPASSLLVFTGRNRPQFGMGSMVKVAAKGQKIFHDDSKVLCSHDLALVLLDKDIDGAQITSVRLDDPITVGETFTAVGWGVTDTSPSPNVRQRRPNVAVLKVGPDATGEPTPPNDFKVGESICSGDSGGPALSTSTNAVIGVVSRGGNGTSNPNDPAAGCLNATNFYTSTSPFKDLILQAFAESGHDPWIEGQPDPRLAKLGGACSKDADCQSNVCAAASSGAASTCTSDCTADPTVCPTGYDCKAQGARSVCLPHENPPPPPKPASGGCNASGASGAGPWALLALLLMTRRRRSHEPL